jgi:hypothetical protein
MAKVAKFSDKLVKAGECINVYFYDNAYMVEANGRDSSDDWVSVKLVAKDLAEVAVMLAEIDSLPRDR